MAKDGACLTPRSIGAAPVDHEESRMTTPLADPAPPPPGGRTTGRWYAGPVPERHQAGGFVFTRLTAVHAELDHAALMCSVDYLRM